MYKVKTFNDWLKTLQSQLNSVPKKDMSRVMKSLKEIWEYRQKNPHIPHSDARLIEAILAIKITKVSIDDNFDLFVNQ
jgi:hypothetical protein